MQQPYEENDSHWLRNSAALATAAGIASPMGRPIRKLVGDAYNKFEKPFAPQVQAIGTELGKIGNTITGLSPELAELTHRAYSAGPYARFAARTEPGVDTDKFNWAGTKQNWQDTMGGVKDIGRAIAALTSATPAAIRMARDKVGTATFSPERWKTFENSAIGRSLSKAQKDTVKILSQNMDPVEATLHMLKAEMGTK